MGLHFSVEMSELVNKMYMNSLVHLRPVYMNVSCFVKLIAGSYCKSWAFQSFNMLLVIGSLIFFLVAVGSGYFYMFPYVQPVILNSENNSASSLVIPNFDNNDLTVNPYMNKTLAGLDSEECDAFDGGWVLDESYPLYDSSLCPFAERGFNCLANGRRDQRYLKWRWKPKNCDIPRFNAKETLELLRGRRVVFVGDSLSRTQWESAICMLMTGVDDKKSVYEVNRHKITKRIRYLGVRFSTFNITIDFYRSVFLVQSGPAPKSTPKRVKSVLKLDTMDDISKEWVDSDVLVFNSGHWWTPSKLFNMGCYFQIGGRLKLGMSINGAFKTALSTWKSWVESKINTSRTDVFFRTFESSHWSSRSGQSCKVTREPMSIVKGLDRSPVSDAIVNVVKNLSIPVTLLHVTPLGAFRSDAHVGTWSDNPSVPDCSHWCLPGVPDTWNELLFSFLLSHHQEPS